MDNTCLFTLVEKLRVIWEVTHDCNESCKHCSVDAETSVIKAAPFSLVKSGLDNLKDGGMESIYYSGGEPLVRPDFLDILAYTASIIDSSKINIATNGKVVYKSIAREIGKLEIGTALVSLDGYTPKMNDDFRGCPGSYYTALRATEYLANENVNVRLGVVIWRDNYQHLEKFVKIGLEHGATNVFFNWYVPVGKGLHNKQLSPPEEEYFNIANNVKELKQKYGGKIGIGFHRFEQIGDSENNCFAGKKVLQILPDGRVSPCSWLYKVDPSCASFSSIVDTPLDVILQEQSFREVENVILKRDELGLGPGCLAMCNVFADGYLNPDPLHKENGLWVKNYAKR